MTISSCRQVDDELIARSVAPPRTLSDASPRQRVLALLAEMARVAQPADGAPRMLHLLARLAETPWLDGILEVRLESFGFATQLEVLTFDGVRFERISGPHVLRVPFEEFVLAVAQESAALRPLEIHWDDPGIELILRGWEPAPESISSITHKTTARSLEKHDTVPVRDTTLPDEAFRGESELPRKTAK